MKIYIALDGGTTNTRLTLIKNGAVTDTVKLAIGARSAIDDRAPLKRGIREGISELLTRNSLSEGDVTNILASGMITSEFGLYKLDHISAPAGIKELHAGMKEVSLPDISSIPFVFISGVKTVTTTRADMMRGEETELMGIASPEDGRCVYVLPGSHSKLIITDENGRIADFYTMLTGEMLAALSQNTILKDAVDLYGGKTDADHLLLGYRYCNENGINEALFQTRIQKNLFGADRDQAYSFFSGVVLCSEINRIIALGAKKAVIGGKAQIAEQIALLLSALSDCEVVRLSEEAVAASTSNGAVRIYEYC